jgi:hypothetical protein
VTLTLNPREDLSYIGLDNRRVLQPGLFLVALGPDVDCRWVTTRRLLEGLKGSLGRKHDPSAIPLGGGDSPSPLRGGTRGGMMVLALCFSGDSCLTAWMMFSRQEIAGAVPELHARDLGRLRPRVRARV